MKLIPLTQGLFAQVNDCWFEELNQFKWHALKRGYTYYAVRQSIIKGKTYVLLMHRVIMNTPPELEVDHKDHNGLNNLEENMRNCTYTQNMMNRNPRGVLGYKGVSKTDKGSFRARLTIRGKTIYIGNFKTPEDAAKAYDKIVIIYHGEFARLNF